MPEQTEQPHSEPSTLSSNGIIIIYSMQFCHDYIKVDRFRHLRILTSSQLYHNIENDGKLTKFN